MERTKMIMGLLLLLAIGAHSCVPDELEPNNDFAHATPISVPYQASLTLCPEGDNDVFRLTVVQPINVTFELECGDEPALLRVEGFLWNATRTSIPILYSQDWTCYYSVTLVPLAGDDSWFVSFNSNFIGDYRWKVYEGPPCYIDQYEPNNSVEDATIVPQLPYNLCPQGDVDLFRLNVTRDMNVTFEVDCNHPHLEVMGYFYDRFGGRMAIAAEDGICTYTTKLTRSTTGYYYMQFHSTSAVGPYWFAAYEGFPKPATPPPRKDKSLVVFTTLGVVLVVIALSAGVLHYVRKRTAAGLGYAAVQQLDSEVSASAGSAGL